jgi:ParB family chromosome partitioning protein
MKTTNPINEIDFHLLDLRYSHTRIQNAKTLRSLQISIQTYGQIVPALAVAEQERYILIDGFKRLLALQACGHDSIKLQLLNANESESLFLLLVQNNERKLEIIEQASLIQELHCRFTCTFSEIATRLGRDKSWVKRRLDLLESLPEEVRHAVMSGKLSSWAASRILVPLARANEQDCLDLTRKIIQDPLSTRELACLYNHYGKSNKTVRSRIIADPGLFVKTLKEQDEKKTGQQIGEGPEGKWFKNISVVCHILRRLKATSEDVLYPNQDDHNRHRCQMWLSDAEKIIVAIKQEAEVHNADSSISNDHH